MANNRTSVDANSGGSRWRRRFTFLGLALLVAVSGACLGAFRVQWVRNDSTGLHLYLEGRECVTHVFSVVPFCGDSLDVGWNDSWLSKYTAHVPGILKGGAFALLLWFALAMGAAWQNSLLFQTALRRLAFCFAPLLLYLPLAGMTTYLESDYLHWVLLIPFAVFAIAIANAIRRTRREALPAKSKTPIQDGSWDFLPLALVWIVAAIRFIDWYAISALRHENFHSQGYDLALMTHVLANFVRGEGLQSSLIVSGGSFLGHHFSPILYLLSPIFFFAPDPNTLLLFQSAAMAFASVPLFAFGRRYLGSAWTSAALALAYLYFPGLSEGVYYDFHAICFAPILLFWLAYEVTRQDRSRYWIPAVLLFMVQENIVLYAAALGLFFILHPQFRMRGLKLFGASVAAAVIIFLILQPIFRPEKDLGYGFVHRYKDFVPEAKPGSSGVLRLLGGVLTSPGTVLEKIFDPTELSVYRRHWGGVFLAPLWAPTGWVLLLPSLENILASEEMMRVWGNHYSFGPVALSSLAMMAAFGFWKRYAWFGKWSLPLSWILLFSSMVWGMLRTQLPFSVFLMGVFYGVEIEPPQVRDVLRAEIPYGSSVAAQTHLLPQVTYQKDLYLIPPGMPHVPIERREPVENLLDFEVVGPSVPWPDCIAYNPKKEGHYWYNLWFHSPEWIEETHSWLAWLNQSGKYEQVYPRENSEVEPVSVIILKRVDAP